MFSLEQLLFAIANDQRSSDETIAKILPMLQDAFNAEKINRQALKVHSPNIPNLAKFIDLFSILGRRCDDFWENKRASQ